MALYILTDKLGRTIQAYTYITPDAITPHKRSSIRHITPIGYIAIKDGKIYILHRTHLIGDQLLREGEANIPPNIITGTFTLNIKKMLPIENAIKRHVKNNNCYVYYCVTPLYYGKCMIPYALHLYTYCIDTRYPLNINCTLSNEHPGYIINYLTGNIKRIDDLYLQTSIKN